LYLVKYKHANSYCVNILVLLSMRAIFRDALFTAGYNIVTEME